MPVPPAVPPREITGSPYHHRVGRWLLLGFLAVLAALVGWFAYDMLPADKVAPGVSLEDRSVGSTSAAQLEQVIAELAEDATAAPVTVTVGDSEITTTAGELGLEVDEDATRTEVLEVGKRFGLSGRISHWVSTIIRSVAVDLVVDLDFDGVADALAEEPAALVSEPRDPVVHESGGVMVVQAGVPERRLNVHAAATDIVEQLDPGRPLAVEGLVDETPPGRSDSQAVAFADRLNEITANGATVSVAGETGRVAPETLRRAIRVDAEGPNYSFGFERETLQEVLVDLFSEVAVPGAKPTFEVVAGEPRVVKPGSPPQGCCAAEAGDALAAALEEGLGGDIALPPAPVGDPELEAWAAGEGVVEEVSSFTTEHACCQARVENIHRIADLVRGVVMYPGDVFSINEFVGERTEEKGFVPAGVISRGRFVDAVGGGISQFATTTFNAAFFAGLDFVEYQSHSIYISRYPYGREATLSYPAPDLVLENTTEYPVLIWTSYTEDSITVTMYSTSHIEVEETRQEEKPFSECTEVETFRSRTYPDGRVVEDSVTARYRPGEGLDCNGNATPEG